MKAVTLKYFTAEMPLREQEYAPVEERAKELAGGVGWRDSQPWIRPVKTPIAYPPRKNRQTRIPLESDWSPFQPTKRGCYPVCRHTPDHCPTKPQYIAESSYAPPIPDPEGHKLPDGSVINKMTFDEKPWLDSAPIDVQAKAGYTNFANDAVTGPIKPGQFWADEDRKHRKAKRHKAVDASQPPNLSLKDSLSSLRGRFCKNCLDGLHEDTATNVRYCSERCRNRSEYARRRGQVGTVSPGIELPSFAVDGERIGIDTDDLAFSRLLAGVT